MYPGHARSLNLGVPGGSHEGSPGKPLDAGALCVVPGNQCRFDTHAGTDQQMQVRYETGLVPFAGPLGRDPRHVVTGEAIHGEDWAGQARRRG